MTSTIRPAFASWPKYNSRLTRGFVRERVFSHDVWHAAEVNEALSRAGLAQIDIWS